MTLATVISGNSSVQSASSPVPGCAEGTKFRTLTFLELVPLITTRGFANRVLVYFYNSVLRVGDNKVKTNSDCLILFVCLFALLLYVPSQQLWSWWDGQFT